jgi:hypothetical protein
MCRWDVFPVIDLMTQKGCVPGNDYESQEWQQCRMDTVGVNLIEVTGCVPSDSDELILVGRVAGPHDKLGNGRPVMTFDCNQ